MLPWGIAGSVGLMLRALVSVMVAIDCLNGYANQYATITSISLDTIASHWDHLHTKQQLTAKIWTPWNLIE
jgi:hypothetical protein